MADIDLIPHDYRHWQRQKVILWRFCVISAALIISLVVAHHILVVANERAIETATDFRARNAITQNQQKQLQQTMDHEADYQRQWSLLQGLRAGAAIEDIFQLVDQSITPGELWFLDWSFRRAGVRVEGEERGVETGYFIVVPTDDNRETAAIEVETHMSIHGQAKDHQALSTFVRALFAQDLVKDVSVRKTSQVQVAGRNIVSFDVTVILTSAAPGSS